MRPLKIFSSITSLLIIGSMSACLNTPTKSPDVVSSIRTSLDQAGLKDINVSQDRDKGVITLTGNATTDADKAQAESIAKSFAGAQVVSDQIAVRPPGSEDVAKKVDSDLDKGIEKNLDAVLVRHNLDSAVKYEVKNRVITLSGKVNSQSKRALVEKLATEVPNVKQVVNELEVKNQKATSSSD